MESDCVSINLDKRADENGNYKCELNSVTREGHKEDLTEDQYFFHHSAEARSKCKFIHLKKKNEKKKQYKSLQSCSLTLHSVPPLISTKRRWG